MVQPKSDKSDLLGEVSFFRAPDDDSILPLGTEGGAAHVGGFAGDGAGDGGAAAPQIETTPEVAAEATAVATDPAALLMPWLDAQAKEMPPPQGAADQLAAMRARRLAARDPKALNAVLAGEGQAQALNETAFVVSQMLQGSGLSLRQIEDRFGFAPAQLSRWSRGKVAPDLSSLKALASALGYRLQLVLERKE